MKRMLGATLPILALVGGSVGSQLCGCNAGGGGAATPLPDNGHEMVGTRLVETEWLNERLEDSKLVIVDARPTAGYLEGHIPGAVSASFGEEEATSRGYNVSYGGGLDFFLDVDNPIPFQDGPPEQLQEAVRGFGINQDDTVVVYDQGAQIHAGRFFWTLTSHGFTDIYILNGGLSKWEADGYATTQDVPTVAEGDFVAADPDPSWVATNDDVFDALTDDNVVLVSGLTPAWHYASYVAYTIPGHIPGTKLVPLANFFNSDGTWKSPEDAQTTLGLVGVTPDKTVITYCGGGPLSACLYFTFRYVLDYPDVRNYATSYIDWITDSRNLSVNSYDDVSRLRDTAWLRWWVGERIQTLVPVSPALAVDVRSAEDYAAGHIPWSVNIPMDDSEGVASTTTTAWAETLGGHGVSNDLEVVIVDETVTPQMTLLYWLLEYLGHEQVSIAYEGLEGWEAAGHPISTEDTVIADPITPIDVAIHPTSYTVVVRPEVRLTDADTASDHPYSRVWVLSAEEIPDDVPVDVYRHVPWTGVLTEDGQLASAGDLWLLYEEADVPFFSEVICYSDDLAEATMTYFALRLLGFPMVSVYLPGNGGL